MNDIVPEFAGLDIYEARKRIVEKLKEIGALIKIEDYTHDVGKCYRCHQTIEPMISKQWFVKMEPLAKPAIEAVKTGKTRFIPERFDKTYFNWLENIKDWCISRQLWWGHRIPAYYCDDCGEIMVGKEMPEKCDKCGSIHLHQDEDTLDTWFSSALWPFSTLGWPEQTEDFKYFYPTSTLVTGYDIIPFWVMRMMFSGIEHTGEVPFKDILIHGIVRDAQGRKMSKSLGNGIDPLEIIDKYGTDALRLSLIMGITPGNDIRYMPEKLESASNFANKLWNASKFVLMNINGIQSGDGGKNDQCVNVPSGVFTINSMSSSFPVCAFIYTKNSLSSTLPLNSQQYTSVCHFVGINANPSLIISKSLFNTSTVPSVIISPAVTSPSFASILITLSSFPSIFRRTSFKLTISSGTSSTTFGIVENSCKTPSILILVIAVPGKEESNILLNELPIVTPYPRSNGSQTNLE